MNNIPSSVSHSPSLTEPTDFSLVLGGPLYQLFLRTRLAGPSFDLLKRRMIVITLVAWLPLLLLTAIEGQTVGAAIKVPFLYDMEVQVRFLLALPLLVAAELLVHQRLRPILPQFLDRGIVPEEAQPQFTAIVASAVRLRNSVVMEVFLIAFVFTAGLYISRELSTLEAATWYATVKDSALQLSLAGYWYGYVSLPLFQFIFLRWYFRLFVWFRLLWQVSRLDLRLIPTHPDEAGGLGFLGNSALAFAPVLLAQGALLSGMIANHIFYEGDTLLAFKQVLAAGVASLILIVLAPLSVFTPRLLEAKRVGLREYGNLASRYVREFDQKWIRGVPEGEALVGSGDIQSLADLANSFAVIRGMNLFPFGRETVLRLAVVTALPILPLTLTLISLEELVLKLLGAVF
jgi:hypothetical protein